MKKPKANAAKPKHELTSQERAAIGKFVARSAADPAPRLKVVNEKQGATLVPDHPA